MSDTFPAVPEGKPYTEADVTKLMEIQGVEREAAIGTFETWISGGGQFINDLGVVFPEVYKAHLAARTDSTSEPVMGEASSTEPTA